MLAIVVGAIIGAGIYIRPASITQALRPPKVPLRAAGVPPGTKLYLIARTALNRNVLLEAAASAGGCLEIGSGGRASY